MTAPAARLQAPDGGPLDVDAVAARLGKGFDVVLGGSHVVRRTCLDTFDRLLRAADFTLEQTTDVPGGRLVLTKADGTVVATPRATGLRWPMLAGGLPAGGSARGGGSGVRHPRADGGLRRPPSGTPGDAAQQGPEDGGPPRDRGGDRPHQPPPGSRHGAPVARVRGPGGPRRHDPARPGVGAGSAAGAGADPPGPGPCRDRPGRARRAAARSDARRFPRRHDGEPAGPARRRRHRVPARLPGRGPPHPGDAEAGPAGAAGRRARAAGSRPSSGSAT